MTLLDPSPVQSAVPLSVAMREGSRAQHDAAESSVFVEELMAGRVSAAGYVAYLRTLHGVYVALEEVGRELADHPVAGRVIDPALDRAGAIEADIATWSVGAAEEELVAVEAAQHYVDLVEATRVQPELYVAHHYTRYLGDLSGGQAIGRLLDREFGLGGSGVEFYAFADIPRVKPYKDAYRVALDELPVTADQHEALVIEVQRSFSANQAIFAELSQHLGAFAR